MPRLNYTADARDDLASIQAYLTRESSSAAVGRRFALMLQQQCAKLSALPFAVGRPRLDLGGDLRSFAFKGYVIFFRHTETIFEVLNVLHGHRDIIAYFADDAS